MRWSCRSRWVREADELTVGHVKGQAFQRDEVAVVFRMFLTRTLVIGQALAIVVVTCPPPSPRQRGDRNEQQPGEHNSDQGQGRSPWACEVPTSAM